MGVVVIAFAGPLSEFEGLPRGLLLFTGVVNLVYGSYSFSLATRRHRPAGLITALVVANFAWVPVCFSLAIVYAGSATPFGLLHLGGEGVFVGLLALLEWRNRDLLVRDP